MKLIHLSDLHFGAETPEIVQQLKYAITGILPDIIIVSGDLTQTGSTQEFEAAKNFLDGFPAATFCVPGNHDIPRYDLWERFIDPYKKYKRHIDENLCPVHERNDVIIAGLNSARPILPHWNWANGAISSAQLKDLKNVYNQSLAKRRVCVFHHPIHEALNTPVDTVVFGAKKALRALHKLKVDLVLTGHAHHASVTALGDVYHKTTYLSASTALSSRLREQENRFNWVEIDQDKLVIQIYTYNGDAFTTSKEALLEQTRLI
ncbi:metallophosphoesterase family protein [Nitrosococcus wardiae]|uniref:Metallophosphoesterase n=1 Tax=Nitrosococcus wardiae TaxID=1814290 RepID=A0A4P7C1U2_9GAMM|nr:metallophosphoesterase [Nitrosococcus wardiae]QBQ55617.1 metallophosphoesterase [Nitrosococcus wardiae]